MSSRLWVWFLKNGQLPFVPDKETNVIVQERIPEGLSEDIDSLYVSLPYVSRPNDEESIKKSLKDYACDKRVKGIIIHNTEELYIVKGSGFSKEKIAGPGLYAWNKESVRVLLNDLDMLMYPYELSKYELKDTGYKDGIMCVYGRTPLMITANCVRKTENACIMGKGAPFSYIRDRKNKELPVLFRCDYCYNIIYNADVTSLHEYIKKDIDFTGNLLLYFTDEDGKTAYSVYDFYKELLKGRTLTFPVREYTKAYFNHGVD